MPQPMECAAQLHFLMHGDAPLDIGDWWAYTNIVNGGNPTSPKIKFKW